MSRKLHLLACALVSAVFLSCSSFVSEKLLHMKRGLSSSEVLKLDDDVVEEKPVSISATGLDTKSAYSVVITEIQAAISDNYFLYAFKDDKLYYWGYPHQFQRSTDPEIRIVGEQAVKYMVDHNYVDATKK